MWTEDRIMKYLKENLNEKRFKHSLSVRDTAIKLAEIYGEDITKAKIAGLVHDCAKYMEKDKMVNIAEKYGYNINEICIQTPSLLHGAAGAYIAKNEMGIEDEDILNAVAYHTTGRKNMSILEKIIYMADYIEPLRSFPGVEEVRELTYLNIDEALIVSLENTMKYIIKKGQLLHCDTVEARNHMVCLKYMEVL